MSELNLIKYHYAKAKLFGIEVSPTMELIRLGFRGIRIADMRLPEFILYQASNIIEDLPLHIEISHESAA